MSRAVGEKLDRLLGRKNGLAERAAALAGRLRELRAWQAARLAQTYTDLRREESTGEAVSFFLSDVYGPQEFTRRDQDVTRAARLLKHALPPRMLEVLSMAIELEVLSAELDLEMAGRLPSGPLTAETYAVTYRAVGREDDRRLQIRLVVEIGRALARAVRTPLIGMALRAAHGPAHLAGLDVLQDFLERGFAAFRGLTTPERLLATIERRETRLMELLLAGGTVPSEAPQAGGSSLR
ncbi:MAG TPA: hypothetical protein VHE11_00575 [Steroidobacteraceae bacterium]|nr:hypothetical protein [Steroidobacteraceae bacterium]